MRIAPPFALAAAALALAGCATTGAQIDEPVQAGAAAPSADPLGQPAPDSMRWLYGSGEAAAASIQAFRALADYAISAAAAMPELSVAMGLPDAAGGTGTSSCRTADGSAKPPAVVFDADETLLLNLGYEYWDATNSGGYDPKVWSAWEREGAAHVAPVPGAVTALKRLREAGITPVFNTNRLSANAQGTIAALSAAGLGNAVHGETLFLKGDDATGSRKDARRATIAARYCVLALAGDNLGDFADLFNAGDRSPQARRELAARGTFAQMWGNGWFVLPNPVYGASVEGTVGEVFPANGRWAPSEEEQ